MQYFKDSVTSKIWAFEDTVKASSINGVWTFATAGGAPLSVLTSLKPTPPPAAVPTASLSGKIAAGITISSTATPALDGVYPMDGASYASLLMTGLYAAQFGMFPSGAAAASVSDTSGNQHVFTIAQFLALLHAISALLSALQAQAVEAAPVWPAQTATIP